MSQRSQAIKHETPSPSPASDKVYGSDAIAASGSAVGVC